MRSFMRERRTICGTSKRAARYQEIEIYPMNDTPESRGHDRLQRGTPAAQRNHNAKTARRFFTQLVNTNFTETDLHFTGTYADDMLPDSIEHAERDYANLLRHLAAKCKAQRLPKPEALGMVEWQDADAQRRAVRYHVHMVLRCALTRDEIEACWHRGKRRLGYANADRLQMDKCSLERLAGYLVKYTNRKHRWHRTRGIKNPIKPPPADGKYTRRQIDRIAKNGALLYSAEFWARKYPGWDLNEAAAEYNEWSGWKISLKMRRRKEVKRRGG